MGIGDSNATDTNDNSQVVIFDKNTSNAVKVDLKTDGTTYGLHTITEIGPRPSYNVMYISQALVNGSSRTMNVNGSVTPQNFLYTVPANTVYYLESISIIISDTGTPTAAKFGDLAALTNGVRLQIKSSGTTYDVYNFKTNGELTMFFNNVFIPPTAGWLNDTDLLVGTVKFEKPIKLNGANSDFVQFTIRDNLTGLNTFISNINMWRVI